MKNLLYIFIILVGLSSCEDEFDYVFDKTPTERKAEANNELTEKLAESEFGWTTTLLVGKTPMPIMGDRITFKFERNGEENNGLVSMASAYGTAESEFAISSEGGSVLRFITPNEVLYWLINPSGFDPKIPTGFGADMEYIYTGTMEGKLYFRGKAKDITMVLEKATAEDADYTKANELRDLYNSTASANFRFLEITGGIEGASEANPLYARIEDPSYAMYFEEELKSRFYSFLHIYEGKRYKGNASCYIFTNEGIIFADPLVIGDKSISTITYNEELNEWTIADEGITGKFITAELPLVPTPGIVDLYINNFFAGERSGVLGMMFDDYYAAGPIKDFLANNYYNNEAPRLNRLAIVNDYISPETGENLGSGLVNRGWDGTSFAFVPLTIEKLGENTIKFIKDGDIITNIDGAAEKLTTDENLVGAIDLLCDEEGWMIGCDMIELYGNDYYDCTFFQVKNPENQMMHMGVVE